MSEERDRRHMEDDPGCIICGIGIEDLNHVLRGCHKAHNL